ncbi:MAG: GGDEF domain-containing protein, partial [Planctomycetes bacterium]|nr:GGDEF domain-containing protein [Planctomycetota bacterium]
LVILGREADCDIRISDRTVSRHHARVEPMEGGYRLVDMQSTNGTFINEEPVTEQQLQDGDNIYIGHAIFRFLAGGNLEAIYHEEIHRLAILDPLTGVHNQRYLLEVLDRELHRSIRYHRRLALLLLDVDRFKSINDQLGHLGGDAALRALVFCIREVVRKEALFARYGGEEFAVVLPESNLEDGVRVAERIRSRVETYPFQYEGTRYSLTVSLGVAVYSGQGEMATQDLLRQADSSLYQAKGQGRNRVMAEQASLTPPPA